jgi:aryl-alcohol dehydrogenase-like predicted oxidoreductase
MTEIAAETTRARQATGAWGVVSSVITGAGSLAELETNMKAVELVLTDAALAAIDRMFPPAKKRP